MTYQSLTNAAFWLDSLIGPGGLLLRVVFHLFAVLFLILRIILGKKKLGCEKYFGRKVTY